MAVSVCKPSCWGCTSHHQTTIMTSLILLAFIELCSSLAPRFGRWTRARCPHSPFKCIVCKGSHYFFTLCPSYFASPLYVPLVLAPLHQNPFWIRYFQPQQRIKAVKCVQRQTVASPFFLLLQHQRSKHPGRPKVDCGLHLSSCSTKICTIFLASHSPFIFCIFHLLGRWVSVTSSTRRRTWTQRREYSVCRKYCSRLCPKTQSSQKCGDSPRKYISYLGSPKFFGVEPSRNSEFTHFTPCRSNFSRIIHQHLVFTRPTFQWPTPRSCCPLHPSLTPHRDLTNIDDRRPLIE